MSQIKYTDEKLKELYLRREKSHVKTLSGQRRHELLFAPYNVSPTEFRVLSFLLFSDGGSEPSVMADSLMVLRQTMTKVIDSLEAKGLVVRTEHPTDRRRVFVKCLPEGLSLARELLILESEYTENTESHFTDEEIRVFRDLFWRMQEARDTELRRILDSRAKGE